MSKQKKLAMVDRWIEETRRAGGDANLVHAIEAKLKNEPDEATRRVLNFALAGEYKAAERYRDAERIYVGKAKGHHSKSQDEINALIAEQALAGRRVVRLKGGDPFVFGRGGEEVDYLRRRGVPVEVVPGIVNIVGLAIASGHCLIFSLLPYAASEINQ